MAGYLVYALKTIACTCGQCKDVFVQAKIPNDLDYKFLAEKLYDGAHLVCPSYVFADFVRSLVLIFQTHVNRCFHKTEVVRSLCAAYQSPVDKFCHENHLCEKGKIYMLEVVKRFVRAKFFHMLKHELYNENKKGDKRRKCKRLIKLENF